MITRHSKKGKSGQALIVTALIIALLLLSGVYYVIETEKTALVSQDQTDTDFSMVKLGARNVLISALANVSNYGPTEVLTEYLNKFSTKLRAVRYDAIMQLAYFPENISPYQNGFLISFGNGSGISSACTAFSINTTGLTENYQTQFTINVTTSLHIEGTSTGDGDQKTVNVTLTMRNENGPDYASGMNFSYLNQTDGSWLNIDPSNLTVLDFGNGTYSVSFNAYSPQPVEISAQILDARYIFVMANTTCTQV